MVVFPHIRKLTVKTIRISVGESERGTTANKSHLIFMNDEGKELFYLNTPRKDQWNQKMELA